MPTVVSKLNRQHFTHTVVHTVFSQSTDGQYYEMLSKIRDSPGTKTMPSCRPT